MRYLETRDIPCPARLEHYPWLQPHSGHDPLVAVAEQQDGLVQGPRHKGCVNWAPIQRQGCEPGGDDAALSHAGHRELGNCDESVRSQHVIVHSMVFH